MMKIPFHELPNYAETIRGLHKNWNPHSGQIAVGRAYFIHQILSIFVQCGRKWGKTELACYFLWRIARMFPKVPCYYIAPLQTQAKEILWADPRVQNFGPREWLLPGSSGINNSELRLNFTNGSFIKVDGSDNYDKYRGPRFKVCVYDEYKDHRPEFRRAMRPNASVLDGLEVFMGSPPDRECDYLSLAEEHKIDDEKFWYHGPTRENHHISKYWLKKEKERLIRIGELDEWEREYEALYRPGGISKIFPMLNRTLVWSHDSIYQQINRDFKNLDFICITDPAAASVFGMLLLAINKYTKSVYVLDQIRETDQQAMTTNQIGTRIARMKDSWFPGRIEWFNVYDSAEAWFANEMISQFNDEGWSPSDKSLRQKTKCLSLIKDIMIDGKLIISERCASEKAPLTHKEEDGPWDLYSELDRYYKDKNGKIPKKNDHLIDCLRMGLDAAHYGLQAEEEYIESKDENFRASKISDDFPELNEMGTFRSEFPID